MEFEEFIEFLRSSGVLDVVYGIFIIVSGIFSLCKIGSISKTLKGDAKMKRMLPNYREKKDSNVTQSFSLEEPTYRYNKEEDILVEDGKIDLQERTNSSRNLALCEILQSLEPIPTEMDKVYEFDNELKDDLDTFTAFCDWKYDICEKYNLSPDLSISKLEEALIKLSSNSALEIEKLKSKISDSSAQVKEVIEDEKKA